MKKIFPVLVLASLLAVLLVPVVSAQPPAELAGKCKMRRDLATAPEWAARGFVCPLTTATDGGPDTGTAAAGECYFSNTKYTCGSCCMMNAVYTVTDWIFVAVVIVAGIMIVYGGFALATSAGEPEKVTTGRNYILYGAIGVIVALLAKTIPALVRSILQLA